MHPVLSTLVFMIGALGQDALIPAIKFAGSGATSCSYAYGKEGVVNRCYETRFNSTRGIESAYGRVKLEYPEAKTGPKCASESLRLCIIAALTSKMLTTIAKKKSFLGMGVTAPEHRGAQ